MHRTLVQYVFHNKAGGTYWDQLESLSNSRDIVRRPTGFYRVTHWIPLSILWEYQGIEIDFGELPMLGAPSRTSPVDDRGQFSLAQYNVPKRKFTVRKL
jgi:hypothetical protein